MPVYVNSGSDEVEPSSNAARKSTNSCSASTSDTRKSQSPLKSPHTWALQASHACRRRPGDDRRSRSSRAGVSGPPASSARRRRDDRLTYPRPATTATDFSSVFTDDPSSTTMFVIVPSINATPLPTTFRRTVPSVIRELTDDAESDALSTTSVLGLSNCVAMPENVPPSVQTAPAAELRCDAARSPSLIWNAFKLVPAVGRT